MRHFAVRTLFSPPFKICLWYLNSREGWHFRAVINLRLGTGQKGQGLWEGRDTSVPPSESLTAAGSVALQGVRGRGRASSSPFLRAHCVGRSSARKSISPAR